MIDYHELLSGIDYGGDVPRQCQEALYTIVQKYNRSYMELERLKEFTGFNKPFPILRLPREIRDEIYSYSLIAKISVRTKPLLFPADNRDNPFVPLTPGLLLANKQIYQETIEMLYSQNIFFFEAPSDLFTFEEQIGPENCRRIKQICIWARFPGFNEIAVDPEDLQPSEYDSVPSHWIAALQRCRLERIVHLSIEAESIGSDPLSLLHMPKGLEGFIRQFLGKVPGNQVPCLSLTGFREEERDKFPERWRVVMDQWGCYKEELAGLQQELEESRLYSDSQWADDVGTTEWEEVDSE
ncbi:hypothetical protein GQ44DRAFT_433242 [Phaeosphaeriaceae sp. PMI808]|nr:hypothetical protein GQ44DRAFT_433242 [Phaeosphaeriaceae sp. PMI808]